MNGVRILLTVAMLIAAAAVAFGQQAPPSAHRGGQHIADAGIKSQTPQGRGGVQSEKKREEIIKKIETVRIWRLTEELKLDPDTAAKLSAFLSSLDQQRKGIFREQLATMGELRTALNVPKPDEAKLKDLLERLERNNHAKQGLKEKEFSGLKDILSTEQQARYVLFQQKFHREMRGMIEGARAGRQGKTGTGPGVPQGK